jgi:hypothetical protein
MEMKDKRNVTLICIIVAAVLSLLFLVVDVNPTYIIAYLFALAGVVSVERCTYMALDRQESYPWIMALPRQAILYLVIELAFSAVVVSPDQLGVWHMMPEWFVIVHAALFAIFIVRVLMMRGAAERIEENGAVTKQETLFIKTLQIDADMLAEQAGDRAAKAQLKQFADSVRYSNLMSNDALVALETEIEKKVIDLKMAVANHETDKVGSLVKEASLLLTERNKKCMLLK